MAYLSISCVEKLAKVIGYDILLFKSSFYYYSFKIFIFKICIIILYSSLSNIYDFIFIFKKILKKNYL